MKRPRPRTQFMAPFVVVLGCGGPKREPAPGPAHPPVASSPLDAGRAAPPGDATVSDGTVIDPGTVPSPDADGPVACYRGHCNPPRPAERPRSVSGKIVAMSRRGDMVEVVIAPAGEVDGSWQVVFIDNDGNDLPNTRAAITKVMDRTVVVLVPGKDLPSGRVRVFDPRSQ